MGRIRNSCNEKSKNKATNSTFFVNLIIKVVFISIKGLEKMLPECYLVTFSPYGSFSKENLRIYSAPLERRYANGIHKNKKLPRW
ncbi:MAG: hypothetical protein HVK37_01520, partial [Pelagibacteraceae bacterium]|nr:hypothetical protein [Pelagibacteraceae bacterium]MBO6486375.1 hypothetical protein [Pelagibacteraceae bacterium]